MLQPLPEGVLIWCCGVHFCIHPTALLPCPTADAFLPRCPCLRALPQADGAAALAAWRARLSYYVYEAVGGLRIADMFDIVVDWPDR